MFKNLLNKLRLRNVSLDYSVHLYRLIYMFLLDITTIYKNLEEFDIKIKRIIIKRKWFYGN